MSSDPFPPAPVEDKRLGMVLQDKYRIVRKIGEGGMGSVYEAEHVLIKRRVAIKALHAHFTSSQELVARFHREALAATAIGNEHIIEVTDMGALPDGTIFMVLEYLDGRDFSSEIEAQGPQRIDRVIHIASQICDALSAAHAKGIVHRDLKPENVFLIRRGDDPDFVKVLDFGISKFKDASMQFGSGMTKTGTTMGTPWYMAPEQAEGRKDIDHRVDLYALGVMMFRALAGQHPFNAESYPKLVMMICNEPAPSLRQFRPDVPEELDAVILRLLAKHKEERFDDALSLKAALAPFRPMSDAPVLGPNARPAVPLGLAQTTPGTPLTIGQTPPGMQFTPPGSPAVQPPSAIAAPTPAFSPAAPRAGRSRAPLIAMGAGALVIGGVIAAVSSGALRGSGSRPPENPTRPTNTLPAAPDASATQGANVPPVPTPTPAPVPTVAVQIVVTPDTAELYLDGNRIANPFDGRLPVSSEPRRLEARLSGYTTVIQDLVLAYEQTVRIRLRRGRGVEDRRRVRTDAGVPPSVVVTGDGGAAVVVASGARDAGSADAAVAAAGAGRDAGGVGVGSPTRDAGAAARDAGATVAARDAGTATTAGSGHADAGASSTAPAATTVTARDAAAAAARPQRRDH